MIYDHFRATGAHEAARDLSDLFNIGSHKDDIQDFETRWDQALLSAREVPKENVLESLYKMIIRECAQLLDCIGNVRPRKKLFEIEQCQAIQD